MRSLEQQIRLIKPSDTVSRIKMHNFSLPRVSHVVKRLINLNPARLRAVSRAEMRVVAR